MFTAILTCGTMLFSACVNNDNPTPPAPPAPPTPPAQVGTYVWGATVYEMGPLGAASLAEAYELAGIKHAILLVKGEGGTVGYFKNTLSNAPLTRTDRDILEETIAAMHAKGIKVYAWLSIGIDDAYQEAHPEQSSYHFRRGFCEEYVDVSQKDYQDYMAKIIKEIDQNYDVDGFALDYVRYQGPYYGWSEDEYKTLTASAANGGYGLTLDEYNELVTLLAKQYSYPIAANEEGRFVYDENGDVPEEEEDALYTAFEDGVKGAVAFGKMREKNIDDICEYLVSQTNKPTYVASMSECTTAPHIATVAYGMTFNQAYTFDVVCPMLYSQDYEADARWVAQNINYLNNLGYKTIIPSLQAYRDGNTETLAADIDATIRTGCPGYLLFRTGTYDIASPKQIDKNTIELTYIRGTESECGNITITINGVTPTAVTMGGKLADTDFTIDNKKITFNGEALEKLSDYGTITIQTKGNSVASLNVVSDARIVYNAPMQ